MAHQKLLPVIQKSWDFKEVHAIPEQKRGEEQWNPIQNDKQAEQYAKMTVTWFREETWGSTCCFSVAAGGTTECDRSDLVKSGNGVTHRIGPWLL